MDREKEIKLRNFYKELPEQQLLDMLSEGEKSFEDGAYVLLVEEAKRRGLEDKLNEIKINKEKIIAEENHLSYKFLKIYATPMMGELAIIKSILDGEKIPYYIKGENFGTLYGPADGFSSMDIMIREDYIEDAKEILKDFISPSQERTQKEGQVSTTGPLASSGSSFSNKIKIVYKNKYLRIGTVSVLIVLFAMVSYSLGRDFYFKMHPDAGKAKYYAEQGKALLAQKKYREAIGQLKKSVIFDSSIAVTYARLGYAFNGLKQYEKAADYCSKAVKLSPNDYKCYEGLGSAYNGLHYYHNAIPCFERSIELNKEDKQGFSFCYVGLAVAYLGLKDYDSSIKNANEALKYDPNNYFAYDFSARVYYFMNQFDKMLEVAKKSIELDPNNFMGYYDAGLACYGLRSYKEALGYFKKCLELNPKYALVHYFMGDIYREIGDSDAMQKECQKLRGLGKYDWADRILGIRRERPSYPYGRPLGL